MCEMHKSTEMNREHLQKLFIVVIKFHLGQGQNSLENERKESHQPISSTDKGI